MTRYKTTRPLWQFFATYIVSAVLGVIAGAFIATGVFL